jgi:3-hydroxybutyryl-CoA dehydrogenase
MSDVTRMGVIGAGQMGGGIAQVAAQRGVSVKLLDRDDALAAKGKERIARQLQRLVDKGRMGGADSAALLDRIETGSDFDMLADAQFVVEAATEDAALKKDLFARADGAVADDAVLASNTSAIPITKLAAATSRPERVLGMHFMNPAPLMKLVEIIRGLQTSDETLERARALAAQLGKDVIAASDMPGFIVNRMLIPFLNEACFALQEGLGTPEDIDRGAKLGLNHPMGPLELADLIGLDTVLYMAEVLHTELGEDKYRPPTILRNHVSAGWLGRKTGRGFYRYD